MSKSELLQWLVQSDQEWQALLDQIGLERMEQPGVNGDWSMQDIVAHLSDWNLHLLNCFGAALRGKPEPPPPWPPHLETDDEINAWIYETHRERAARDVLDEARQINAQLYALVEDLPATAQIELVEPAYYLVWLGNQRFLPGEFYDHFRDDHEQNVRAWLAQQEN